MAPVVKESARKCRSPGSVPRLGKIPGGRHDQTPPVLLLKGLVNPESLAGCSPGTTSQTQPSNCALTLLRVGSNKHGDRIQPRHAPFQTLSQSVVACPLQLLHCGFHDTSGAILYTRPALAVLLYSLFH